MNRIPCAFAAALAAFLLLFPCAAGAVDRTRSPDKMVDEISAKIEELKGLKFRNRVPVGLKTRSELREFLVKSFDEELPEKKARDLERAYKKFGLIPKDCDLRKTVLDMLTSQIGGFYDPQTKELYVIKPGEKGDADPMMRQVDTFLKLAGTSLEELVAAHELVHALQDQHYDLLKLQMPVSENDDRVNALKCLFEGDAVDIQNEFLFSKLPERLKGMIKAMSKAQGESGFNIPQPGLENVPEFLKVSLVFPYIAGPKMIETLRKRGEAASLEKYFKNPPLSTEQVLHLEKLLDQVDEPTAVTFEKIEKAFDGAPRLIDKNVMGELGVMTLLKLFIGEGEADKAAAGWDGDMYGAFELGGDTVLVWISTWDSEEDAREFAEAYKKVLDKKYDGKGEFDLSSEMTSGLAIAGMSGGGGYNIIAIQGSDVVVIEGPKADAANRIARRIWKHFTKGPYKHHTLLPMPQGKAPLPESTAEKIEAGEFLVPAPDQGFRKYARRGDMIRFSFRNDRIDASIDGAVLKLGEKLSPAEVVELMKKSLPGRIGNLAVAEAGPVQGAGLEGFQLTYSGTDPDTGAAMSFRHAVFCLGKKAYVFTASSPAKSFGEIIEYFGRMLKAAEIRQ